MGQPAASTSGGLVHPALFYRTAEELRSAVTRFVGDGLAAGEPALLALPGDHLAAVRRHLGRIGDQVAYADMRVLGRNPERIRPAFHEFIAAHPGRRLRVVGEPIWPGRTAREITECVRHEALINVVFAEAPITVLCPYAQAVGDAVLDAATRTHPLLIENGRQRHSDGYTDPAVVTTDCDRHPLPPPPDGTPAHEFGPGYLPRLRHLVAEYAHQVGLLPERIQEFLVAVNEVTANSLEHGGGHGWIRFWSSASELICEVTDRGHLKEPFPGHLPPTGYADHGRGLWLVRQLCDHVAIRRGVSGTTVRLHVTLPPTAAVGSDGVRGVSGAGRARQIL